LAADPQTGCYSVMEIGGYFTVYNSISVIVWFTGIVGANGIYVLLSDDGNVYVKDDLVPTLQNFFL
jgi:hypothetical protein